ncbi:hypothetical protein KFE98_16175 [bacterium SCSIO 12741]|nr:hypothetical protein KFE98_16175 [bacterium SCSIO 12741]
MKIPANQIRKSTLLVFILVLTLGINTRSQTHTEFKVERPKTPIVFDPEYRYLFQNVEHPMFFTVEDSTKNFTLEVLGGTLRKSGDTTWIRPLQNDTVWLQIFDSTAEGIELTAIRRFKVYPELKPYIQQVPSDSFLFDLQLVPNRIYAAAPNYKQRLRVTSFTVNYIGPEGSRSVDVEGDMLPPEIRKELGSLNRDVFVRYTNIRVSFGRGLTARIANYNITLITTKGKKMREIKM